MVQDPAEQFANGAMAYISAGQLLGALAFLIGSVWVWALFYRRVGGIGGFALGMILGALFGLLGAAVTFVAWPLTVLAGIVFWISRRSPRPQRHAPL